MTQDIPTSPKPKEITNESVDEKPPFSAADIFAPKNSDTFKDFRAAINADGTALPTGFPQEVQVAFENGQSRDKVGASQPSEQTQKIDKAAREAVAAIEANGIDIQAVEKALQTAHKLDPDKGVKSLVETMNKKLQALDSPTRVKVEPSPLNKKSVKFSLIENGSEQSTYLNVEKRNYAAESGAEEAAAEKQNKANWQNLFQEEYGKSGAAGVKKLAEAINTELKESGSTKEIRLTPEKENPDLAQLTIKDKRNGSSSGMELKLRDRAAEGIAELISAGGLEYKPIDQAFKAAFERDGKEGIKMLEASINRSMESIDTKQQTGEKKFESAAQKASRPRSISVEPSLLKDGSQNFIIHYRSGGTQSILINPQEFDHPRSDFNK